jgi:hypothetical protein
MIDDLCIFDYPYLSGRGSNIVSSESDKSIHIRKESKANNPKVSYMWHPLMGAPLHSCEGVGLGYWPDGSIGIGRHFWRLSGSHKKAKKKVKA